MTSFLFCDILHIMTNIYIFFVFFLKVVVFFSIFCVLLDKNIIRGEIICFHHLLWI